MLRPTLVFASIAAVFFLAFAVFQGERTDLWLFWLGAACAMMAMIFGLFGLMERFAPMEPRSPRSTLTPHDAMRSKAPAGGTQSPGNTRKAA